MAAAVAAGPGAWQSGWAGPSGGAAKPWSACDRAAFRVVVDVGHTAQSPGAISARGIWEYEFNLQLAKLIEQRLLHAGFGRTVLLVTDGPARRSLAERVAHANALAPDLFLSIHHDSVPDRFLEKWEYEGQEHVFSDRFKGHSIFISNDNADPNGSLLFGHLMGEQLKARGLHYTSHYIEKFMGHRQRLLVDAKAGVYRYDQLIVLKSTRMPAVLLEAGSIINRDEEVQLSSPERQSLTADAVTDAIDSFCAVRRPRQIERASVGAKPPLSLNAVAQPAKSAGAR
ncbi:MAG: N-acetylmuramoyl-L-alanine amidase [Xanthobacteraceae bacterium]